MINREKKIPSNTFFLTSREIYYNTRVYIKYAK